MSFKKFILLLPDNSFNVNNKIFLCTYSHKSYLNYFLCSKDTAHELFCGDLN